MNTGIGLSGLLTTVFVVLKLIGYISWPWIWVLAPSWIPILITILIYFMYYVLYFLLKK